jgi:hypothetical protein
MKCLVDTNVAVVANHKTSQASPECIHTCASRLQQLQQKDILVLDNGWHIIGEYMKQLNQSGQPGVGDAFLKWVLTNWSNPSRCELVSITLHPGREDQNDFLEFPDDPDLGDFDRSDRKFVATALAHPEHPPILNATDTDWRDHEAALQRHGILITFLCPDMMVQST